MFSLSQTREVTRAASQTFTRMEEKSKDFCLKWDQFQSNLALTFDQLRRCEDFVDVTLSVGGNSIKCHKVVLSAASPYFAQLLSGTSPSDHPVIILNEMDQSDLSLLVEYIYCGEVRVAPERLDSVMAVAEVLGIRGLLKAEANSPCKKRRLYEDNPPESQRSVITSISSNGAGASPVLPRAPRLSVSSPAAAASRQTGADLDGFNDIRPDILEMIKEEQKAKLLEPNTNWNSNSSANMPGGPGGPYCYQNQLQNMWQKCWNQNASVFQGLRYRERGPMKSWRSETMAEAIWSVLQEGLSLSQAARKHDIPYPTFVLYANRVHNMLGPSPLNGYGMGDLRPKGRGRPQRILLGQWPEDHVREVIRAVVFREGELSGSPPSSTPLTAKSEPTESPAQAQAHPLAAESRAAQAAFEAQMKQFYNNPFASQLLAASSKMFTNVDLNTFLQSQVKVEAPDEDNFEDAESEAARSQSRAENNHPVDLVTHSMKSIDAIASKLVNTVENEGKNSDKTSRPSTSASKPGQCDDREIKDNVYNCSEEIRKTIKSVGERSVAVTPLLSHGSQERKSV